MTSSLILLWSENITQIILFFLSESKFISWTRNGLYWHMTPEHLNRMCISLLLSKMLYQLESIVNDVEFYYVLADFLIILLVVERGMLMSPTIIVMNLSISPFSFFIFYFFLAFHILQCFCMV